MGGIPLRVNRMPFSVQIKTHKVTRWTACAARFASSREAERHAESLKRHHPTIITETRVEPTRNAVNARWRAGKGLTWDE